MKRRLKSKDFNPIQSYDDFFDSHSRVTGIQFWGLTVIGFSLIASGCLFFLLSMWRIWAVEFDIFKLLIILMLFVISAGVVLFGVYHLKRAFAGRK